MLALIILFFNTFDGATPEPFSPRGVYEISEGRIIIAPGATLSAPRHIPQNEPMYWQIRWKTTSTCDQTIALAPGIQFGTKDGRFILNGFTIPLDVTPGEWYTMRLAPEHVVIDGDSWSWPSGTWWVSPCDPQVEIDYVEMVSPDHITPPHVF